MKKNTVSNFIKTVHPDNISPPIGSILRVSNGCLLVDDKPFCVDYPDGDLRDVKNNKLITKFDGDELYWELSEISGYWA